MSKIKLVVVNWLEKDLYYEPNPAERSRRIKPYDEEKFKNRSVYYFNSLKDVGDFVKSCNIEFTEEYRKRNFTAWEWEEIYVRYLIDQTEDNTLVFEIGTQYRTL